MSRSEDRANTIREQRNVLLSSLRASWPGTISGESLYRAMIGSFPDYDRRACFKDLTYLEQKGYAIRKDPRTGRDTTDVKWDVARWCLTVQGTEVADKLIDDPALEV